MLSKYVPLRTWMCTQLWLDRPRLVHYITICSFAALHMALITFVDLSSSRFLCHCCAIVCNYTAQVTIPFGFEQSNFVLEFQ
jgi:hypothetical protein